jgi:acyl-CoA synthetase (AMP-forming)/AMP-acid ligase II
MAAMFHSTKFHFEMSKADVLFQKSNSTFVENDAEINYSSLMELVGNNLTKYNTSFIALSPQANIISAGIILWALKNKKSLILFDPHYSEAQIGDLLERFKPSIHIVASHELVKDWTSPSWRIEVVELGAATTEDFRVPQLLLSTSGTTGNPRHVRLGMKAVNSNASAIVCGLGLSGSDSTVINLGLHYSYGLSVLTSGVAAGIAFHFISSNFMESGFWEYLDSKRITYISGVPFFWESLIRMKLDLSQHPSLRLLTQAGGKLSVKIQKLILEQCLQSGSEFRAMYGQTEAGPRMTIMDWDAYPEKLGSVGKPILGSEIEIFEPDDQGIGEVIFSGPGVMLGYADTESDLFLDDELNGRLRTGDLGYFDSDGYLWITGRLKRIAKINGLRINLDDVESQLTGAFEVYAVASDRIIYLFHGKGSEISQKDVKDFSFRLGIPSKLFKSIEIDEVPTLSSGKTNYQDLMRIANE